MLYALMMAGRRTSTNINAESAAPNTITPGIHHTLNDVTPIIFNTHNTAAITTLNLNIIFVFPS